MIIIKYSIIFVFDRRGTVSNKFIPPVSRQQDEENKIDQRWVFFYLFYTQTRYHFSYFQIFLDLDSRPYHYEILIVYNFFWKRKWGTIYSIHSTTENFSGNNQFFQKRSLCFFQILDHPRFNFKSNASLLLRWIMVDVLEP